MVLGCGVRWTTGYRHVMEGMEEPLGERERGLGDLSPPRRGNTRGLRGSSAVHGWGVLFEMPQIFVMGFFAFQGD